MKLTRKALRLAGPAVALAAAVVAGNMPVAQAASAPAAHVKPFAGAFARIQNVGNGMCLQPLAPVVNSAVVQEPCVPDDGSTASNMQGWEVQSMGGNTYGFLNQQSGACLFAFTGAHTGAPMGLNTCRKVSNEQFDTHAQLPNVVELESKIGFSDTGFCVADPNSSPLGGVQMELFPCDGSLSQRWTVGFN